MKVSFSKNKPTESGHYLIRYNGRISEVYVGESQKTSSQFNLPFNYGLAVNLSGEIVPVEWTYCEWSEKIEVQN